MNLRCYECYSQVLYGTYVRIHVVRWNDEWLLLSEGFITYDEVGELDV